MEITLAQQQFFFETSDIDIIFKNTNTNLAVIRKLAFDRLGIKKRYSIRNINFSIKVFCKLLVY